MSDPQPPHLRVALAKELASQGNEHLALINAVGSYQQLAALQIDALCVQAQMLRRIGEEPEHAEVLLARALDLAGIAHDGPPPLVLETRILRERGLVDLVRPEGSRQQGLTRLKMAISRLKGGRGRPSSHPLEYALTLSAIGKACAVFGRHETAKHRLVAALDGLQPEPAEQTDALLWLLRVEPDRRERQRLNELVQQNLASGRDSRAQLAERAERLVQCNICATRTIMWRRHM